MSSDTVVDVCWYVRPVLYSVRRRSYTRLTRPYRAVLTETSASPEGESGRSPFYTLISLWISFGLARALAFVPLL